MKCRYFIENGDDGIVLETRHFFSNTVSWKESETTLP